MSPENCGTNKEQSTLHPSLISTKVFHKTSPEISTLTISSPSSFTFIISPTSFKDIDLETKKRGIQATLTESGWFKSCEKKKEMVGQHRKTRSN
jgi:hypothetical protein